MRRLLVLLAAVVIIGAGAPVALGAAPPPPPPPPGCKSCPGPPPPPTPVPTVAPTQVAPDLLVVVSLSPTHAHRGHDVKLQITSSLDATATMTVRYHRGRSTTYHGTVHSSNKLTKSWKIPKTAPLGSGRVSVTVSSSAGKYSTTVTFTVTK